MYRYPLRSSTPTVAPLLGNAHPRHSGEANLGERAMCEATGRCGVVPRRQDMKANINGL